LFKQVVVAGMMMLAAASVDAAVTTRDFSQLTPEEVATLLAGPGATISNVHVTGSNASIGTFNGGFEVYQVGTGLVLSTGAIVDIVGPNNAPSSGLDMGTPGDPQLTALVNPLSTHDAIVLEFDVVTQSADLGIRYVFASEEYPEYVDSIYNDVFAFWVNGANIALAPGGLPVTINTINPHLNAGLFRNNYLGTQLMDTEFDGLTRPMLATTTVTPGAPVHVKIAVADTSDGIYDTAVMLAAGGVTGLPPVQLGAEPQRVLAIPGGQYPVDLTLSFVFMDDALVLDAPQLPEGVEVSFSPIEAHDDFSIHSTMAVTVTGEARPGIYTIPVRLTRNETQEVWGSLLLDLDCNPPMILGIEQPQSQTVLEGESATLRVGNVGSPGRYQWYRGFSGFTRSPIEGATEAEFTIPAVFGWEQYWVRIENGCGTADSSTVMVRATH
jgi:hypothetical protein